MNRFYTCLVVSLMLHAAVIIPYQILEKHWLNNIPQVIRVALVDSPVAAQPLAAENTAKYDFDINYSEDSTQGKEDDLPEKTRDPDISDKRDEQTDRINGIPVDSINKADFGYYGKVKGKILINYNYPRKATNAGIQGYVQVTFTIDKSGNVSSIKVTKSSGYRILDVVSSRAVLDASPFEPRDNDINMEVGFHYILDN